MASTASTSDSEINSSVTSVQTLNHHEEERPPDDGRDDTGHRQTTTSPSRYESEDRKRRREIRLYVEEKFKNRRCAKYIPRTEKTERDRCQCGRGPDWHRNEGIIPVTFRSPRETWDSEEHTIPIKATSFGEICFAGFGEGSSDYVPYIRVDSKQDQEACWTLLTKHWQMPPPKFIISVIGDANYFSSERELKKGFQKSLIRAATTAEAWIITDGLANELVKSVGEAAMDHMMPTSGSRQRIVVLGIAPWGCVENKESLVAKSKRGLFSACYRVDDLAHNNQSSMAPLDHNHTHFLLVDDGTEGNLGMEQHFRIAFEELISKAIIKAAKKRNVTTAAQRKHAAVVYLLLEGEKNALLTALEVLKKNIPVIVLQGSGGVADLIAECYRTSSEDLSEEIFDKRFLNGAISLLPSSKKRDKKEQKKMLDCLRNLLEYKDLVTLLTFDDLHTKQEINQAILDAIPEAQKCLLGLTTDTFREVFRALVQNNLDRCHEVDLHTFLTVERLQDLYADVLSDKSYGKSAGLLRNLLHEVRKWDGDYYGCFKENPKLLLSAVDEVVNQCLLNQHHDLYEDMVGDKRGKSQPQRKRRCENQEPDFPHPEKDLLIWAVLLNRKELAERFWKSSKDLIGSALVASDLLESLSERADEEGLTDLGLELREHSIEFQDKAIGILNECNLKDEIMAQQLLVRDLKTWDNTNVLAIAGWAREEEFMGQAACQTKLNKIWKGKMAIYTSCWKIAIVLLFPLLIPIIEFKKGDEHQQETKPVDTKTEGGQQNIGNYFFDAPVVKFWYHVFSQVIFLALFSTFVLTDLRPLSEPDSPGPEEITVSIWVVSLVAEEIRQVISQLISSGRSLTRWRQSSSFKRFVVYMVIHAMFFISFVLRFTTDGSTFVWARRFYCLTLFGYYLTFMRVFFVAESLGPKVIMIYLMLKDMVLFLFIFLVFTLAYGVALQALRFPNSDAGFSSVLLGVVYLPYWHLYGELFLDQLEGDGPDCSRNETELKLNNHLTRCPEDSSLAIVLLAVYMVLTNIILLNLLIAMFSNTFEKVQEKSQKVWRFYRYGLIREYLERPALAPPLIIFTHVWRIIQYIKYKRSGYFEEKHDCFHQEFDRDYANKLTTFERSGMKDHLYDEHIRNRQNVDTKVTTVGKRMTKVIDGLDFLKMHHRRFDSST